MKINKLLRISVLVLLLCTIMAAVALSANGYDLSWWTVDGGGGSSSGNVYRLVGTAGQFDAGAALRGGSYRLEGGFWVGQGRSLYLPFTFK